MQYLKEIGVKTAKEIINNNVGKERQCWCGEQESSEYILLK